METTKKQELIRRITQKWVVKMREDLSLYLAKKLEQLESEGDEPIKSWDELDRLLEREGVAFLKEWLPKAHMCPWRNGGCENEKDC